MEEEFQARNRDLFDFINNSPSPYHVVANCEEALQKSGFTRLAEEEEWHLKWGGRYYVTRNGSSLLAFCLPEKGRARGVHLVASHSDSPCFKLKEAPEVNSDGYVKLNVEKYGGMIMSTWLDRSLSVAGRLAVREGNGIALKPVNIDRDLMVIPNVAIHMNRDMNKGVEYNPQTDMQPLYALEEDREGSFMDQIAAAAGVDTRDILGQDLFLYVRDQGRSLGGNGELILSPRLDDLQCVFASLQAFMEADPCEYINMCVVFDNEEVGSGTRQGAGSTFLEDALVRMCESLHLSGQQYRMLLAGSFFISADNAHAVHPNHPEKADPVNRPSLNKGIVIKYHGSQKYTTDAYSAGMLKLKCEEAGAPYQSYLNRSDIAGGSTLGNISTAHVSVATVDIGLPQLAMHSAVETAGAKDTEYAVRLFRAFYSE